MDSMSGEISNRYDLQTKCLVLALLALATGFHSLSAEDKRPNIVVILCDDHRYDAMGFMGHPFIETPHMDRLAAEGVHFENAFVTTSLCSPSRASILTGMYAHRHGVIDNYNPVSEELVFFPQLLQQSGYETAFIGKWHMGGNIDEPQRGFDHWLSFKGQGVYWTDPSKSSVKSRYVPQASRDGYNVNGKERIDQEGYITDELSQFTLDWLGERESDKPFFLYVSHKAAHADFIPAERHAYRYKDQKLPIQKDWKGNKAIEEGKPIWVQNQRNSRHGVEYAYYSHLDMEQYYQRYCETLLAVDDSVGELLNWLDESGESENTLVLYLGDNGFLFGEHGLIDKRNAYEESMRIPLMVRFPRVAPKGVKVPAMVANIDIAPTLLDVAGIKVPKHMDGRSFFPMLKGKKIPWRKHLLYEYFWERNYPQTPLHTLFEEIGISIFDTMGFGIKMNYMI
jgi:N-acetylglucosamine-6-sulfatase